MPKTHTLYTLYLMETQRDPAAAPILCLGLLTSYGGCGCFSTSTNCRPWSTFARPDTSCPGLDLLVCDFCEPPARMETLQGQPWLLPLSAPSTQRRARCVVYLRYICCMNGCSQAECEPPKAPTEHPYHTLHLWLPSDSLSQCLWKA